MHLDILMVNIQSYSNNWLGENEDFHDIETSQLIWTTELVFWTVLKSVTETSDRYDKFPQSLSL